MAEPDSIYTFRGLVEAVAEKLGVAEYTTAGVLYVPTDLFNLNLCKRYVTNGVKMFMSNAPHKGWRWMRRLCSVTFDAEGDGDDNISSDAARYMLPANFGGTADGKIMYDADTNHSTKIEWCDEAKIRSLRATVVNTGYPSLAAIRPYQPTSEDLTSSRRWELIVDPQPSAADTVKFPYTLSFDKMDMESGIATSGTTTTLVDITNRKNNEANNYFNDWIIRIVAGTGVGETATINDFVRNTGTFLFNAGLSGGSTPDTTSVYVVEPAANLHPAGHQFDDAVYAACLARTEMESQDEHMDNFWTTYYRQVALPDAHRLDLRSAPRKLGQMTDGRAQVRERTWNDITTDHDV